MAAVRVEDQGEGLLFLYLTAASQSEVIESILQVCRSESIRVLVIFGLETLVALIPYVSVFPRLDHLQQTLIAVVEGPLTGAGSDLALCCDLVVVGPSASLTSAEVSCCLDQGSLGAQYQWSSSPAPALPQERVLASQLVSLGIATRLSNDAKEDAMALGSRVAFLIRDFQRSLRQTFASSWRYNPKL